jgi:hypothetical protein
VIRPPIVVPIKVLSGFFRVPKKLSILGKLKCLESIFNEKPQFVAKREPTETIYHHSYTWSWTGSETSVGPNRNVFGSRRNGSELSERILL